MITATAVPYAMWRSYLFDGPFGGAAAADMTIRMVTGDPAFHIRFKPDPEPQTERFKRYRKITKGDVK
jgi:hypothetical protein